jgi:hypothetical protein
MEYNFTILIPFGDSARYDLVIEKEGNFGEYSVRREEYEI